MGEEIKRGGALVLAEAFWLCSVDPVAGIIVVDLV